MIDDSVLDQVCIGYTMATAKLFGDLEKFQEFVESLLQRKVDIYEMKTEGFWNELRYTFEHQVSPPTIDTGCGC